MEDLEQKIGQVLSDPEQMQKIMELANSLGLRSEDAQPALPQELAQNKSTGREAALLEALKPFLKPHHRQKLERAIQISRLSKLAKLALQQAEEERQ